MIDLIVVDGRVVRVLLDGGDVTEDCTSVVVLPGRRGVVKLLVRDEDGHPRRYVPEPSSFWSKLLGRKPREPILLRYAATDELRISTTTTTD